MNARSRKGYSQSSSSLRGAVIVQKGAIDNTVLIQMIERCCTGDEGVGVDDIVCYFTTRQHPLESWCFGMSGYWCFGMSDQPYSGLLIALTKPFYTASTSVGKLDTPGIYFIWHVYKSCRLGNTVQLLCTDV
jgi:hypothetical protein